MRSVAEITEEIDRCPNPTTPEQLAVDDALKWAIGLSPHSPYDGVADPNEGQ